MAFIARSFLRLVCMLALVPAAVAPAAEAQRMQAKIVAMGSASAFAVLDSAHKLRRVKLTGVDAPERRQPFFEQARQLASEYLETSPVEIVVDAVDDDARIHGRIAVDGRDLGLVLLQEGFAWCDPADSSHLPRALRAAYAQACEQARAARRGLWRDAHAVPPWEFRKVPHFAPPPQTDATRHCRDLGQQTIQCDDGSRYRGRGERVLGSDGTVYSRRGNTITGSDGNRFEIQGRSIYGTDGSVCRRRGRSIDCF